MVYLLIRLVLDRSMLTRKPILQYITKFTSYIRDHPANVPLLVIVIIDIPDHLATFL
jgi:hypothetical protein